MLKKMQIVDGKISDCAACDGQIFIYIAPDDNERKYLIDDLKVDEHTLTSALDPGELGRLEFEPDHSALIIKRPKRYTTNDNFFFHVSSIGLFVYADKLIIILPESAPLLNDRKTFKINSLYDVVLRILFGSIFHFEEHLKVINMCSEELEGEVNQAMGNKQLLNMFTLEKSLVYYLNAISSNGRVIEKLKVNAAKIGLTQDNVEFIDDIAIENAQCFEQAQIYSQVLSGLMDARASVVSNNLNIMMKNLNALVIAVAVPSFFAGVGGMSEFTGMTGSYKWYITYPIFVAVMLLIGTVTFYLIKKAERFWKQP